MIASIVPSATTCPPSSPAPGPMSMMWSAARIIDSSCSTMSTVLPRSRSRSSVLISRSSSTGCRPMLGSSQTYSTPIRLEPICVASRMRCASPPESVPAVAVEREVVEPDIEHEREPGADLLEDLPRDRLLALVQRRVRRREHARTTSRRLAHVHRRHFDDVLLGHGDGQRLRLQPRALAGRCRARPPCTSRSRRGCTRSRSRW